MDGLGLYNLSFRAIGFNLTDTGAKKRGYVDLIRRLYFPQCCIGWIPSSRETKNLRLADRPPYRQVRTNGPIMATSANASRGALFLSSLLVGIWPMSSVPDLKDRTDDLPRATFVEICAFRSSASESAPRSLFFGGAESIREPIRSSQKNGDAECICWVFMFATPISDIKY